MDSYTESSNSSTTTKKRRALSVPTVLFKLSPTTKNDTKTDKKSDRRSSQPNSIETGITRPITAKQALQLRANMLPYRENGVLKYMPASPLPAQPHSTTLLSPTTSIYPHSTASGSSTDLANPNLISNGYDSDLEPLIGSNIGPTNSPFPMGRTEDLDEDAVMRFTATGRPMPVFKPSGLANLGGHMFIAPQHLPQRYTDESVIPVIVRLPVRPPLGDGGGAPGGIATSPSSRRKSFLGKFKNDKETPVKVVYMPRGEYLKYFARDHNAKYIGSEPEQEWTEVELDEKYGKYKRI